MRSLFRSLAVFLSTVVVSGSTGCDRARDPPPDEATLVEGAVVPAEVSHLDALIAEAEAAYWDGDFDVARAHWRQALKRKEVAKDATAKARIHTWLGLAAYRLGEYEEARRLGEEALGEKQRLGLQEDLFKSYNALGLLAWNEGRLSDAAGLFREASEAARTVDDDEGLAKAKNNLGLVYTELGEFDLADESFQGTVIAGRALGDARIEGTGHNNLGMLAVKVGDAMTSLESLEEARRLYRSIGYVNGEQNTLGQLATAYIALGNPSRAITVLDTALAMAREQGLRQEEASNLGLIGELYHHAGDFPRALQYYDRSHSLNEELGLEIERGTNLRSEADIYASLGGLDRARELAAEALKIHMTVGARFEALEDLVQLVDLNVESSDLASAKAHMRMARELLDELPTRAARVDLAMTDARLAEASREYPSVIRVLDEVQADLKRGGYDEQWEAEQLRARAYAGLGISDSAAAAGRRAVAAVERVRRNFGSTMLRTTFVSDRISAYTELVDYLLRLGEVEEAFEVADAGRGRALLEHLATVRRVDGSGTAVHALAKGEELLRGIDALVEMLDEIEKIPPDERTSADRETVEHLSRKLIESRNRYESLVVQVAERDAATEALVIGRMGGVVSAVQAALDPGEVLLEYLVTSDRLRLFVVTPTRVYSLESSISAADVTSRVRLARGLVGNPSFSREDYPPVLERLYETLLGPAVQSGALSNARRLIIVPHGVLSYLPFAGLRDKVTGRYLVEDYVLQHLPSAAALSILRGQVTRHRSESYGAVSGNVFVPFPDRFPASFRESDTIRRVLPGTKSHRGGRATESAVLNALRGDGIVHLATHGVLNVKNPMFSMLELRPGVSGSPTDDGRLEIHELVGERLNSPLVFLSGCETGVGAAWATSFAQGEDYATMAKVFLYAGAKNVVATLWRIEDKGAAVFAERFYRNLETYGPAEAIARAQREMVDDPLYSAPFYWAAYQLSGEG